MSVKINHSWLCIFLLILSDAALSETTPSLASASLPTSTHHCSFNGKFIQLKELTGLPIPLESQGRFYSHCKHGIIWKTNSPSQETLIFSNNGSAFSVSNSQPTLLNSRHAKFIGQLILGLINGEHQQIIKNFKIIKSDKSSFTLTPKRRSIKKAIQKIEISFFNTQPKSNFSSIQIKILDRNNEKTSITSSKIDTFTSITPALQDCTKDALISPIECSVLINDFAKSYHQFQQ